jgi:hypothetical protein
MKGIFDEGRRGIAPSVKFHPNLLRRKHDWQGVLQSVSKRVSASFSILTWFVSPVALPIFVPRVLSLPWPPCPGMWRMSANGDH